MRAFAVCDAAQRSPEWFQARLGRVTGSRAKDVLATVKTGEAAARRDYRVQLAVERITSTVAEDGFQSDDMKRGIELEDAAFAAYEAVTGEMVSRVGFLVHTDMMVGTSPDGVLGDYAGLLELKVPRSANHLRYLRDGGVPKEHLAQLQHALFVSGAEYIDFASFDPRFPSDLQLFVVRLKREDVDLASYEMVMKLFLREVDEEVETVKGLRRAV